MAPITLSTIWFLELEEIGQLNVVALGPDLAAAGGIAELGAYPEPLARAAHASIEDVAHTELAPDLRHVNDLPPVAERRISRGYEEPAQPLRCG